MILTSFLLASAGLHVGVLGEGRLRFEAGRSVAFSSASNLTVNAKGLLSDTKGRPVLPHIALAKAAFSVAMNGTVSISGKKVGRLMLQKPDGEIGFPGDKTFGVIELAPTTPPSYPFIAGGVMQGSLRRTDDPLNIAIVGNGFFRVLQEDGVLAYTRNGDFRLDANGKVVTRDGLALDPEVTVPQGARSISVSEKGSVSVILPGAYSAIVIGRIELTSFLNPGGLYSLGHNRFAATDACGDAINSEPGLNGTGDLQGGYLEILPVLPTFKESLQR